MPGRLECSDRVLVAINTNDIGPLSVFFFKQKTAYEISECDWSPDVCSSDPWGAPASYTAADPVPGYRPRWCVQDRRETRFFAMALQFEVEWNGSLLVDHGTRGMVFHLRLC